MINKRLKKPVKKLKNDKAIKFILKRELVFNQIFDYKIVD